MFNSTQNNFDSHVHMYLDWIDRWYEESKFEAALERAQELEFENAFETDVPF